MNKNNKRVHGSDAVTDNPKCIPWHGFDKYFKYVAEEDNNIKLLCLSCLPSRKTKSTSKKSSTNLKRHMQKVHPFKYSQFLKDIEPNLSFSEDMNDGFVGCSVDISTNNKKFNVSQSTLHRFGTGSEILTQNKLDMAIMHFIVEDTQPISIVDKPVFLNLVRMGLPKNLSIMCSKTLKTRIQLSYETMVDDIIKKMSNIQWISETTDCWTLGKKSYLGVTAHWINTKTLAREGSSLACTVIKGHHTYDLLANQIHAINTKYKIINKVITTTTDNGSNFVKAFKIFGVGENNVTEVCDEEQLTQDEEIEFIELNNIIEESDHIDFEDLPIRLSSHRRCVSHTLNLIATSDIEKWFIDNQKQNGVSKLKKLNRKLFAKLSKLWSKQNQSTLIAQHIHELLNVYLRVPNKTRWNSTYDALLQLKTIINAHNGLEKVNKIMDFSSLPRMLPEEVVYINEFCDIFGPIADSLDFLQGEKSMYMGYLLPTLHALEKKIATRQRKPMIHCSLLLEAVLRAIKNRFEPIWMEKELVIAACLIPKFKLNWLVGQNRMVAEAYLKTEFSCFVSDMSDCSSNDFGDDSDSSKDFFCLPKVTSPKKIGPDQDLNNFLVNKSNDLQSLFTFPKVLSKFIQFNTGLPSSAPVERLFSTGGNVMTPKRHRLGDNIFESLILLKQNKALNEQKKFLNV